MLRILLLARGMQAWASQRPNETQKLRHGVDTSSTGGCCSEQASRCSMSDSHHLAMEERQKQRSPAGRG